MLSLGEMFQHVKTIFIRFINETICAKSYLFGSTPDGGINYIGRRNDSVFQ